jgi:prepilin peptidase CpaA
MRARANRGPTSESARPAMSISDVLLLLFQATFVFCLCYAVVSDFTRLLIPNWIPLVLVGAFAIFAAVFLDLDSVLRHLMLAGVVFALGFAFFAAGWVGGGDVKLMTATTLWIGSEGATSFVVLMAALGAGLALLLLAIKKYPDIYRAWAPRSWFVTRLVELAETGRCPYGVAIGIAGLIPTGKSVWLLSGAG